MASEQERAMIAQLEYDKRLDNPSAMHKPITYGVHNEKTLGASADWLLNDFPMAFNISVGITQPTNQLAKASQTLNHLMDTHKDAHFDIYGHSLGSMNAQYALANVHDSSRIDSAHIYEGSNIYSTLTDKQKKTAEKLRNRIHNYVDPKDFIALNYVNNLETVGRIHKVNSIRKDPVNQHMWGGYQWQKDGSLAESKPDLADMKKAFSYYRIFNTNKATSSQGKFVLDSIQAQYIADSFTAYTPTLENDAKTVYETQRQHLEETLSIAISNMKAQLFPIPADEIDSLLYTQGLTTSQLLARFDNMTTTDITATRQVSADIENLRNTINTDIQHVIDNDSSLAQAVQEFATIYRQGEKTADPTRSSRKRSKSPHR